MVNKKIKAIAKIERDAQNYFFVKMLYGYSDSQSKLQTIYEIHDEELINNLSTLSYNVLSKFRWNSYIGNSIVLYNTINKFRYSGFGPDNLKSNRIIVGTMPELDFQEINYLIRMISLTMKKENIGDFFIQYKDKVMTEEEFYKYQEELSIYTV